MKMLFLVVLLLWNYKEGAHATQGADTKYCYSCAEQNNATCLAKQQNQTCAANRSSLGTGHCASVVVRYRNQSGKTMEGFFQGCVNCSKSKKALYAAVGEFYNASRGWFLMQGEIICCTGDNCNTNVSSLPPAGAQYRHCNYCLEPDVANRSANQRNQICATDPESFGTSHCASAAVKYEDKDGKARSGFVRGCINCASKSTACAVIRSDVKRFYNWTLKQCEIECCTGNNCNNHTIPGPGARALTVSAASPDGRNVLFSEVLVFGAAFASIFYYIK